MMWPRFEPSPYTCRVLMEGELREWEGERIILAIAGA
jgi:hypothetical protein